MRNAANMTTAQRILAGHQYCTFAQALALEAEAREVAKKITAPSCFERTWTFYDGSSITKTSDGYTTGAR